MKKQKEILVGIVILIAGFFIGIMAAIIVVESSLPSSASNDGWLGFLGGLFGSVISGLVAYFILYVNRKETIKIQDDQKRQAEYQMRKQFVDDIAEVIAAYITDISIYYYDQVINDGDRKPNRRLAVEKYYVLHMKLHQIKEAEELLCSLDELHNNCFFNKTYEQMQEFDQLIKKLEDESKKFIYQYTFEG